MNIRKAREDDADAVRSVYLSAFPEGERDLISVLAVEMLSEVAAMPLVSLVADIDGAIIGHVAFSPVTSGQTKEHLGYILAPLAVCPAHQKQGVASQMIKMGVEYLAKLGPGVLLVYGDPGFYGRFGFAADQAACYKPPYQLEYPFGWQAMGLGDFDFPASAVSICCVSSLGKPALW